MSTIDITVKSKWIKKTDYWWGWFWRFTSCGLRKSFVLSPSDLGYNKSEIISGPTLPLIWVESKSFQRRLFSTLISFRFQVQQSRCSHQLWRANIWLENEWLRFIFRLIGTILHSVLPVATSLSKCASPPTDGSSILPNTHPASNI